VQTTGFAPVQAPVWHVSVWVHALPSEHPAPFGLVGLEQTPVPGLHVPTSWHWLSAVQTMGFMPVQTPAWQVSLCVHALLSLHAVPFGLIGVEQVPEPGSHTPASWQPSIGVHVTGFPPVQTPAWHVWLCKHRFPGLLHVEPSGLFGLEHTPVPGLHVPTA
jgi:hypothetical protein